MKNKEIAALFERIADVLEIKGENIFRVNSYRKVARVLDEMTEDVAEVAKAGRLESIAGVGKGTAEKIVEYLDTGRMSKYEEVMKGFPPGLADMLDIPGMGPKTVALVWQKLGVVDLAGLEKAIADGKALGLPGMGEKKVANIQKGIALLRSRAGRLLLGVAFPLVQEILGRMRQAPGVRQIEAAGSLRRMKETIGDIDILVAAAEGKRIIEAFTKLPNVVEVLAAGDTKGSVRVGENKLQVDLRVVAEDEFGAALQYFTGSKAHNIRLRDLAKGKGLKVNEYGVFKGERKVAGRTEESVYEALGMLWTPPELREDRGEVEAAQAKKLPKLVTRDDILGDLHAHSEWSDGNAPIAAMAEAARKQGHQYMVLSDHSPSLKIANGLSVKRLLAQVSEVDKLNEKLKGFTILKGSEVDIKADGSLDLPDEVLAKLDFVTASVHVGFKDPTDRILAAIRNPYVSCIGHPTGRLIGQRDPYPVDMDKVMAACAETGTALEINAYQDRLDLNDVYCRRAKELGVKVAIGTDSHKTEHLWMMTLGVGVARRGWLGPADVLNTLSVKQLREWRAAKRAKRMG